MTTRTRYFVIASLLVLGVGMGSGLVAYYSSYPMSAFMRRGGPDEFKYVPADVSVLAYADVQDVMHSQLRQKLHDAMPTSENGQREFQDETGINIETDIEHTVAFAEECKRMLEKTYATRLGSLERVPVLAIDQKELRTLPLDHRGGFLLSHIDGI